MKRSLILAAGMLSVVAANLPAYSQATKAFHSLQMKNVAVVNVPVDADAAARRLSEGVKFPTISNQDRKNFDEKAFRDWHAFLEKTYPLVHKNLKRELIGDPREYTLLYTWKGTESSLDPIILMGHQDVVPVVPGTEKQWEHGAFSGDIAGGYIWGRGTLDDKIMIQAILEAIEMQLKNGFKPKRSIYLVFGQDEEVGGAEGVKNVVAALRARGVKKVALVFDEGLPLAPGLFPGISAPTAPIGTAEKGYVSLELKVAGAGGHSAMPPRNSNIGILAQAITKLEANPFPYRITQAVRDQYRFMGPELPEKYHALLMEVARGKDADKPVVHKPQAAPEYGDNVNVAWQSQNASEDEFIRYMLTNPMTTALIHTTTAVTMVNGGVKENVLPPFATAVVNFRILQGETVKSVIERVTQIIDDKRVSVKDISASIDPSPVSDPYGQEYKLLEKTIRQTWGTPDLIVMPYLVIGGADAKWFAASGMTKNVYRFTAVRVESAADSGRWHGVNERVLVSEYAKSIGFFYQLIANAQSLK